MQEVKTPASWQQNPWIQLLAVALGVLPVYLLIILPEIMRPASEPFQVPTILDMLLNLLLLVGGFSLVMVVLLNYMCGERLRSLEPGRINIISDIVTGTVLGMVLVVIQVVYSLILSSFLPNHGMAQSVVDLGHVLADDPAQFYLWIGPVVWLQGGWFEEFQRAFLLTRLWNVWVSPAGKVLSVIGASLLFGLGHSYQEAFGIIGTALIGLVLGFYYLHQRKLIPMIIAHIVYNTYTILVLVSSVRLGLI